MGIKRAFLFGAALLAFLAIIFTIGRKNVTFSAPSAPTPTPAAGDLAGICICVDAGHGGYDGGAVARDSGVLEKDINLAVALCLRDALQAQGAQVIMTREVDTALADAGAQRKRRDLQYRVDAAQGAQMFLSIHMNEYTSRAESGPQVFYRAGQADSRLLAGVLQARLIADLAPSRQRSAHTGEYYLLEHLQIPAVLVECGFLSNAQEEALLLTPAYQQQLANAICSGVRDYFRLSGRDEGDEGEERTKENVTFLSQERAAGPPDSYECGILLPVLNPRESRKNAVIYIVVKAGSLLLS